LDRILKNSRVVDTESLCILPGEQVFALRTDIHILDHDGNIIDAVVAAALAALIDFRRPDFTITQDGVKIVMPFMHPH
jgi:exosome complex component RRP45